jgi:hypothetical protein
MIEKVDYKALWEQMCQRCDELDKKLAQRTWVGLTDKDWNRSKHNYDFQKGVDWAESILKEKNNG